MRKDNEISLDDLVTRVQAAAWKMGKRNPNRILLLNTAAALSSLGHRLETALADIADLNARHVIITNDIPGGGLHRVN